MQEVIIQANDTDMKLITPLLDRMGIAYRGVGTTSDPEALDVAQTRAGDPLASVEEQEQAFKSMGI